MEYRNVLNLPIPSDGFAVAVGKHIRRHVAGARQSNEGSAYAPRQTATLEELARFAGTRDQQDPILGVLYDCQNVSAGDSDTFSVTGPKTAMFLQTIGIHREPPSIGEAFREYARAVVRDSYGSLASDQATASAKESALRAKCREVSDEVNREKERTQEAERQLSLEKQVSSDLRGELKQWRDKEVEDELRETRGRLQMAERRIEELESEKAVA